jgi:hypothetical protein
MWVNQWTPISMKFTYENEAADPRYRAAEAQILNFLTAHAGWPMIQCTPVDLIT